MSNPTFLNQAAIVTAPAAHVGATAPVLPQLISGTGTTEATQAVALNHGRYYRLVNNTSVAVYFGGAGSSGLTNIISNVYPVLPAFSSTDFFATPLTTFIYVEAADGTSAFACSVYENDCYRNH